MPDLFENPMGLMGFEFVEFASPTPGLLEPVLERMGFTLVARHRSKNVVLFRQGDINFIVNSEPKSVAAYFASEHGPCACGMAFRVKDAHLAYQRAIELGAQPIEIRTGPMELNLPAIKGIGGAPLYLIDRFEDGKSIYDIDFDFYDSVDRHPVGHGLKSIDHLTHNVYRGRMAFWGGFYEKLFNFREIRYFDIQGEYTGLTSRAMTAPDGKIRIPLNEESKQGGGQIEEFLLKFNGEGIQHIALICDDLISTVDRLARAGVPLMAAPSASYYEMLDGRLPGHGQPVPALQTRGILLDGSTEGGTPRLLLQIFSEAQLGPVFFEFIQRQGDEGFGEGNFKALFESLERDQLRRGVIEPKGLGDKSSALSSTQNGTSEVQGDRMKIDRIHHVAYRCKDARETVQWYQRMLKMDFVLAIAEDFVPSTKAPDPYMHVFLDAGQGNVLAFFELPTQPPMGRDPNTPSWVQHIAFKVKDRPTLLEFRAHLEAQGVEVLGVTDHGVFHSIYFFDPNGHRLELACPDPEAEAQLKKLDAVKWDMLEEWSSTKRAPKHAAFLHQREFGP